MTETLGVGIVGCGNISHAYLTLASNFRGFEMRACADLDASAADARAREFGVAARTVDALLAADDIDIVVNLTVPSAHASVSGAALEAGKHVWSEKPFVLSVAEGQRLAALADATGLRLGSTPDTFLGGCHQTARELVDAGAIGTVRHGTAHVMSRGMEHWHPSPGFFYQPGAGPVLDVGPYHLTNLVQLLGPVARVQAVTSAPSRERVVTAPNRSVERVPVGVDTTVHALLEFACGAHVAFGASWDTVQHDLPPMQLHGDLGSLTVPDPNFFGGELALHLRDGTAAEPDPSSHPFARTNFTDDNGRLQANYRCSGLADMAQAIADDRPHRCDAALALHVVDAMTSILAAGERGEAITLTTTCERPAPLDAAAAAALLR